MDTEKRMAGDYEIIHAVHIGDNEVVVGENPKDTDGQKYMVANCRMNELFARYDEVLVSDDYPEIMKYFGQRIAAQAEKVKNELIREDVDTTPITADKCEPDSYDKCIEGKVIVIRAEVLRQEYQVSTRQIQLCTGGFGAQANSRGSACFCTNLFNGKQSRFERRDVLGELKPEYLPEWTKQKLVEIQKEQAEKQIKPKDKGAR
jgi:hypothetical protein